MEASTVAEHDLRDVDHENNTHTPLPPLDMGEKAKQQAEAATEVPNNRIDDDDEVSKMMLTGGTLAFVTFALELGLFLSTLEISIVGTALVSISNDFHGFSQSSWIVTSYLLTYTGFIIIWAKCSDILGRRACLMTALIVFMVASGACGGAQSINQLIVFRAFQGIGGSGILSLVFVIIPEMVSPQKYAKYAAITACTFAISYLIGPLGGGAICDGTTWRWVFLLNLPGSLLAMVLLYIFLPASFPHSVGAKLSTKDAIASIRSRIDWLGATLLLGASSCLVAALQQAGTQLAWSSPTIIVLLILTACFWVAFVAWEDLIDRKGLGQEPVFTTRLMKHRVYIGGVIVSLLAGMPFTIAVIQIPQRFQAINGVSALEAGIRLLPFTLGVSVGTIIANVLASRLRVPVLVLLLVGAILQLVAIALMSTLSPLAVPNIYWYEAILSLGIGMNIGILVQSTPQIIRGKDQSIAMGALTQFRALGGVIGLAVATNALYGRVRSQLASVLSETQLTALLESAQNLQALPESLHAQVNAVFAEGYNLQMRIMTGFAAAQILVIAGMWEKNWRRVA